MMQRVVRRGGLVMAVVALAVVGVACLPASPPPAPGALSMSPSSVDYGSHPLANLLGANMPIITVTVTSTGGQAVQLVSETASDGIYSMPTNTCASASLAAGQRCHIDLQYCPSSTGTVAATLTVTGTSGGNPVSSTINVTGTAT
jgi:hypothetical protein